MMCMNKVTLHLVNGESKELLASDIEQVEDFMLFLINDEPVLIVNSKHILFIEILKLETIH